MAPQGQERVPWGMRLGKTLCSLRVCGPLGRVRGRLGLLFPPSSSMLFGGNSPFQANTVCLEGTQKPVHLQWCTGFWLYGDVQ